MELQTLNDYNNINRINFGDTIVVFKFGGNWCQPCKNMEDKIKDIPNCILYNISVDNQEFESFMMDNQIYKIPDCIVKYKNKIQRLKGDISREEIIAFFNKMRLS